MIDLIALPLVSTKLFLEHKGRLTGLSCKPSIGGTPIYGNPHKNYDTEFACCKSRHYLCVCGGYNHFSTSLGSPCSVRRSYKIVSTRVSLIRFQPVLRFNVDCCTILWSPIFWDMVYERNCTPLFVLHKLRTDSKIHKVACSQDTVKLRQLKHGFLNMMFSRGRKTPMEGAATAKLRCFGSAWVLPAFRSPGDPLRFLKSI